MKTLLILFLVGVCVIGLQSPEIMQVVGVAGSAQDPAGLPMTAAGAPQRSDDFIDSGKLLERNELDKVLNFFARGKYK